MFWEIYVVHGIHLFQTIKNSFCLCSKFQIVTQYCWCDYFGLWQWLTGHFFSLSSRKSIKTRISSRSSFRSRCLCNYCGGRSGMFINTIWINAKAIFTWCSILHSCWILGLLYILQVFINYYCYYHLKFKVYF